MKSLSLSQAATLLALAIVSCLVPACGPGGASSPAFALSAPSVTGPTIHEAYAPAMVIVPGTGTSSTYTAVKSWVFTPGQGEIMLRAQITGEYLFVPAGGTSSNTSVLQLTAYVTGRDTATGILRSSVLSQSPLVNLTKVDSTHWQQFYCTLTPAFNVARPTVFSYPDGAVTFVLETTTNQDWSGDFQNMKLEVYTAPFARVADSPSLQ